ncbi:hypothetical protein H6G91_24385 [Nostoc muscorum FACHB-395]|jgi:hypothetical protein|nr:hypothetical protein [Desmonostoc muscorum FACHB-395]
MKTSEACVQSQYIFSQCPLLLCGSLRQAAPRLRKKNDFDKERVLALTEPYCVQSMNTLKIWDVTHAQTLTQP